MPERTRPFVVFLGSTSALEPYKDDPDSDVIKIKARPDLGKRVVSMLLAETTPVAHSNGELGPEDELSRPMNAAMVKHLWPMQSDKPPVWVEGDDEELVKLVADAMGCRIGRPKNWKEG